MKISAGDSRKKSGLGPQSSVQRLGTGRCMLVYVQKPTSSGKHKVDCRMDPGRPLVATLITTLTQPSPAQPVTKCFTLFPVLRTIHLSRKITHVTRKKKIFVSAYAFGVVCLCAFVAQIRGCFQIHVCMYHLCVYLESLCIGVQLGLCELDVQICPRC